MELNVWLGFEYGVTHHGVTYVLIFVHVISIDFPSCQGHGDAKLSYNVVVYLPCVHLLPGTISTTPERLIQV